MPDASEQITPALTVEPADASEVEVPKTAADSDPATVEGEEKPRGGFQRRIDKLTREKYELSGQLRELRDRMERIEQGKTQAETRQTEAEDPKPDLQTFKGTYEEFIESLTRWATRQEHKTYTVKREQETEKQTQAQQEEQTYGEYQERTRDFIDEHDDYNEVVGRIRLTEGVSRAVQVAIIEDDNGPALAYYLGQHPELCDQLGEMTPARAVLKLGAIAAQLAPESATEEEQEETPVTPTPPKPKAKAPEPIRPLRKPAPTDKGLSDELSVDEWMRRRLKQTS